MHLLGSNTTHGSLEPPPSYLKFIYPGVCQWNMIKFKYQWNKNKVPFFLYFFL